MRVTAPAHYNGFQAGQLLIHSPSSLVTHIEALLSTGIRLQTHKDSSCRYTRPGLQASLYCLQPA